MNKHSENSEPSNSTKPVLAPIIYWNDFKKVKPSADEEYLVLAVRWQFQDRKQQINNKH